MIMRHYYQATTRRETCEFVVGMLLTNWNVDDNLNIAVRTVTRVIGGNSTVAVVVVMVLVDQRDAWSSTRISQTLRRIKNHVLLIQRTALPTPDQSSTPACLAYY
jgi:hypothetical protein